MAEQIDIHLDNILRASGSGLKYYSMQKTLDDMRAALTAAVAALARPSWLSIDVDRDELVIHGKRYAAAMFAADGLAGIPGALLQLVDGNAEAVTLKRWTIRNLDKILAEVDRATVKFPTWPNDALHAIAILGEEFGELTKANLQMTYEPHKVTADDVASESIQTAAMALRFAMSLGRYSYTPSEQHSQGSDA